MVHLDACIVTTAHLEASVAFYRAIGLPLETEQHEAGPAHWACELGPVHFAIYEGTPTQIGGTMLGFQVDGLAALIEQLRGSGVEIPLEPESVPWGTRAIVVDPDGRLVELNEASRIE